MTTAYVHGYEPRESSRLQDQATTLVDLLHSNTVYPAGSHVLEAGCGVGAQTVMLARNSPGDAATFDQGIEALYRTTELDGTFCYTFFKATAKA